MAASTYRVDYIGRAIELQIVDDRELVLLLDGIARKRRDRSGVSCVYVWTNIESNWEEHHFIEARWWPRDGRVCMTANRKPLLDVTRAAVTDGT